MAVLFLCFFIKIRQKRRKNVVSLSFIENKKYISIIKFRMSKTLKSTGYLIPIFAYNPGGNGAMTQVCSMATNNTNSSRYITNYINTFFWDGSHDKSSGREGNCAPKGSISTERLKDTSLRYKANATIYNSTVPQSGSVESKEAVFNWYN